MTRPTKFSRGRFQTGLAFLLILSIPAMLNAQPTAAAAAAFSSYIRSVEARLALQHRSTDFLILNTPDEAKELRAGTIRVERIAAPSLAADDAMLHHWRATAFAPGATAAQFKCLLQDFDSYPRIFAPQVLQARVLNQSPNRMQAWMRIRQRHVITVVMDATYNIDFAQTDAAHGYSSSRSSEITIEPSEGGSPRVLSISDRQGLLWGINTYWTYLERDGGLYLQVESVSMTRSVPAGLGWLLRPYVESVPRESLEFTMRSAQTFLAANRRQIQIKGQVK